MESEAKAMRKIKWGVMGTAFICERSTFPGMLQAENCEMYAIAGRNMEKAERFKETYGFQKAYGSYEKLLADPKVEAVYIPLPNTMHYEWTIRALKSGKHVLCEKPLAPTEAQAEEMFKAAEENHVYLMEAFAYQHSPYIAAVRKEIENGTIGDVRYMESAYITSDYDPKNIRMRRDTLGGCTYDLGVYNTSLILRILGDEPAKVRAIASFSEEKIDTLTSFDGREEMKTISVPQNYRLEVEQMGRCVEGKETPAVTRGFSLANARMIDAILEEIGY
ncbi:gfo/Idh/MocA family oxidoreductase [Blautia obeum]|uniref:Gfo/Idh/MocA family oxidoreductase n=2 Tax=Blautia obeum TaxID=40520 RepID=A0A414I6B2_9FIRM|nr:gfo/Idh/MocA family oxidoreductase [Blautia obeum]RHM31605.1 gfo/Idh/MocA family oxidoreductase [Blautia obeum]